MSNDKQWGTAEQAFTDRLRESLDQQVASLDWQTQARLTRMRLQILERQQQGGHSSSTSRFPSFSQGFALATVATLASVLWLMPDVGEEGAGDKQVSLPHDQVNANATEAGMDATVLDVLLANEEMDFLQDLEMYEWLAQHS